MASSPPRRSSPSALPPPSHPYLLIHIQHPNFHFLGQYGPSFEKVSAGHLGGSSANSTTRKICKQFIQILADLGISFLLALRIQGDQGSYLSPPKLRYLSARAAHSANDFTIQWKILLIEGYFHVLFEQLVDFHRVLAQGRQQFPVVIVHIPAFFGKEEQRFVGIGWG